MSSASSRLAADNDPTAEAMCHTVLAIDYTKSIDKGWATFEKNIWMIWATRQKKSDGTFWREVDAGNSSAFQLSPLDATFKQTLEKKSDFWPMVNTMMHRAIRETSKDDINTEKLCHYLLDTCNDSPGSLTSWLSWRLRCLWVKNLNVHGGLLHLPMSKANKKWMANDYLPTLFMSVRRATERQMHHAKTIEQRSTLRGVVNIDNWVDRDTQSEVYRWMCDFYKELLSPGWINPAVLKADKTYRSIMLGNPNDGRSKSLVYRYKRNNIWTKQQEQAMRAKFAVAGPMSGDLPTTLEMKRKMQTQTTMVEEELTQPMYPYAWHAFDTEFKAILRIATDNSDKYITR